MREFAALLSVLGLLFVWSIPGTVALRHLLMLLALLSLASLSPGRNMLAALRANRMPALLIALLTAWLVAQAFFVSPEMDWALSELKGQWFTAGLALLVGTALAALAGVGRMPDAKFVTTAMTGMLIGEVALSVSLVLVFWLVCGEVLYQVVPLIEGKLEMSYLVNILLAALTVDLLYRVTGYGEFLRLPTPAVIAVLPIALASTLLSGARNGVLGAVFLSFSALTLFAIDRYRRKGLGSTLLLSFLLVFLVGAFAAVNVQTDRRWATFSESARLGWDIDNNKAWANTAEIAFPALGGNIELDTSAYVRVAFIHASLRLIGEHPLGVGYGRNAFAHALRQTEKTNVGHAHSGLMDLGIGGGIPAMILWALFIGSLMVAGWRRYLRGNDPHGLLLLLLATGFMGRMMLDSVNRDHMLQMFMFLVGYLLTVSSVPRPAGAGSHTPLPP